MTAREYLDMLRREDSVRCNACGSAEICAHREAEARAAGVELQLPGTQSTRPAPFGRATIEGKWRRTRDWYWTGTRWRRRPDG